MNKLTKFYIWSKLWIPIRKVWDKYCVIFVIAGIGLVILSLVHWIATVEARVDVLSKEHMEFREIRELRKTVQAMQDEKNSLMKVPLAPPETWQ